jgi:Phosphotransferase enzyme family
MPKRTSSRTANSPASPWSTTPWQSPRLAPGLGGFLGRLHRAPLEEFEHLVERDAYPLTAWLEDAERDYLEISGHLSAAARRQVEDFLGRTPPAEPRALAFCHGDMGTEHVLMDTGDGMITGIIDWTDAAIADPACDLAPIYRDLGSEVFERTLDHYGTGLDEADRERSAFYARCKLLEDVAYGLNTPGARRYAEVGLANLLRTFYSDTSGGSGRRLACQPFPRSVSQEARSHRTRSGRHPCSPFDGPGGRSSVGLRSATGCRGLRRRSARKVQGGGEGRAKRVPVERRLCLRPRRRRGGRGDGDRPSSVPPVMGDGRKRGETRK